MKNKTIKKWMKGITDLVLAQNLTISKIIKQLGAYDKRLAALEARQNALTMKVEELEKRLLGVGGIEKRLEAAEDNLDDTRNAVLGMKPQKYAPEWADYAAAECNKGGRYLTAEQVMVLKDLRDRLMGVTNPNPVTAEVLEVLDDLFAQ